MKERIGTRRGALVVAIALAALSALVLLVYVRGLERRALANAEPVEVLVAKDVIPAGTTAEDASARGLVGLEPLPRAAVLDGAASELDVLAGRVSTVDILPGEQLVEARFAAPGAAGGALPIPADRQAVSVEVALPPGVGGFVRPGDHVSVIAKVDLPDGPRARYVVQGVEVLAVGDRVMHAQPSEDEEQTPTDRVMLTLALSAPDAEKVVFSVLQGQVYFTLLPPGQGRADTPGRDATDVFS